MSKYAIIKLNGKQFRVSAGDKLVLDHLSQEEDKEFKISEVLLIGDEKGQTIGTPMVEKASVTCKVLSHQKGKKIRVGKFRAKSKYRRVYGHRQPQTTIEITKITL
jgi:large subunit ribosomal protein L21